MAFPRVGQAQWPPDSLQNIQALPKDITVRQLIGVMRGFADALGVRCQYCHVGEEGQPLSEFKFPLDDKVTKRKARTMIKMVSHINQDLLPGLETRGTPEVQVECATCHRGQPRPRMIDDVLREAYAEGGIDSMSAKYRELRQRYYGSHTFDFRWFILNNLAAELGNRGNLADAEALLSLNLEFFPDDPRVQTPQALAAIEGAMMRGGPEAGLARYHELEDRLPPGRAREVELTRMGYRLMNRKLLPAAIAVLNLNVELNPQSWNAYDSLGEAYMNNGDTELAIKNYEQSLKLNPGNTNAVDRLKKLRGN